MKRKLDNQYQRWEEKIESRNVCNTDIYIAQEFFRVTMKTHRDDLEHAIFKTSDGKLKQDLKLLNGELDELLFQLIEKCSNFINLVKDIIKQKGLTPQRIQQFEQFTADESFVGDQCVICMGDIEIGRNMMRLDCDGQHTFCQVCIEGWFANHKTCPICRHKF